MMVYITGRKRVNETFQNNIEAKTDQLTYLNAGVDKPDMFVTQAWENKHVSVVYP